MTSSSNTRGRGLAGRTKPGMILRIPGPIPADQGSDNSDTAGNPEQGPRGITSLTADVPRQGPTDVSSQCAPSLTLQGLRKETRGPMTPPLRHRQPAISISKEEKSQTDTNTAASVVENDARTEVGSNGPCVDSEPSDSVVSGSVGSGPRGEITDVRTTSGSEQRVDKCPEASSGNSTETNAAPPVMKRKPSLKNRSRDNSNKTSESESGETTSSSELLADGSQAPSIPPRSASSHTLSAADAAQPDVPTANPRRRISFAADSVLTAVIQDGDTAELVRILTGRHGPGLVQLPRAGEVRGVDVCQTNHVGLTALHQAVLANNLDAAKLLLCHGADVNAQDVHGFSPLHTAAACGYLPLTSLLVVFGADVFAVTGDQELAVDVAKDLPVVRLLSQEMVRLTHQELWLSALLRAHAEEVWVTTRKLLAWGLLLLLHLVLWVRTFWGSRRKKSD
ncbi:hypothetical protein ACOMHN_040288 [Nucella lapillus]